LTAGIRSGIINPHGTQDDMTALFNNREFGIKRRAKNYRKPLIFFYEIFVLFVEI